MRRIALFCCFIGIVACKDKDTAGGGQDPGPAPIPCEFPDDCDDGNPCTLGQCPGGECRFEAIEDGVPCDDGDACTENGICAAGVCAGDVVDCSGFTDQCNLPGCDPAVGCIRDPLADGLACDDIDACTVGDACQGGTCVAGAPTDCTSLDSTCAQGECNMSSGICETVAINEGMSCDDGLFCSDGETCTAGLCAGGTPLDCTGLDGPCSLGECNETAGACEVLPINQGVACDDGLFCTDSDACDAGVCIGALLDCSGAGNTCNSGICDEVLNSCVLQPANENGSCDDGQFCTTGDRCQAGVCASGSPTDCADVDACTSDGCDEGGDVCTNTPIGPIPNAEGPPPPNDSGTCGDGLDNDCDGDVDLADANCQACSGNGDCDDGNPCTDDVCSGSFVCVNTPAPGRACDDGLACTDPDTCDASGICAGPAVDCSSLDDQCNTGSCSESAGGCIAVAANEGGGCFDGLFCTVGETCQLGACAGPARDCSSAADDCNAGLCNDGTDACDADPLPDGTACIIDLCTSGADCTAGSCGGGAPLLCDDGDGCTSDWCDTASGCLTAPVQIDASSVVAVNAADPTQACMVAGTAARVLVYADLRDTIGLPLSGGSVTIGGLPATESVGQPGIYWAEIAAAGAPGSRAISVDVSACGDNLTLTDSVGITDVAANPYVEGTGGCSPMDGNLRLRVVERETGNPIVNANVLIGPSQTFGIESSGDALFGGASSLGTTALSTDGSGFVEVFDYGTTLGAPATVTAGAPGRVYVTLVDFEASDVILALPELNPTQPGTSVYSGTGTPASTANCNNLDVGLVAPKLDLELLSGFSFDNLLGRSRCWDSGSGLVGTVVIPGNVWIPAQTKRLFLFCASNLTEAPWTLTLDNTADTGELENLQLVFGSAPISQLLGIITGGGSLTDALSLLNFRHVGFQLDENVAGDRLSENPPADGEFPNTFGVTFINQPAETDVVGVTVADYAGTNGTGPLFLLGTSLAAWDSGATSVLMPNSDLAATSAPPGARRLAGVAAFYLDAAAAGRTTPPPLNREDAATTLLIRDDGMGNAPFDASGNTTPMPVGTFLGLSGTTYGGPNSFTWEDATGPSGNRPQYSMHELVIERTKRMPPLSCEPNSNEDLSERSLQWLVYKPFGVGCATEECFTLPTLPVTFPRAGVAARKRDGFEPAVGSGAGCAVATECNQAIGEDCVDPDLDGTALRCMGGGGTETDPYFEEDFVWRLHIYDLELLPSFDFNDFDFTLHRGNVTHESSNSETIN